MRWCSPGVQALYLRCTNVEVPCCMANEVVLMRNQRVINRIVSFVGAEHANTMQIQDHLKKWKYSPSMFQLANILARNSHFVKVSSAGDYSEGKRLHHAVWRISKSSPYTSAASTSAERAGHSIFPSPQCVNCTRTVSKNSQSRQCARCVRVRGPLNSQQKKEEVVHQCPECCEPLTQPSGGKGIWICVKTRCLNQFKEIILVGGF